LATRKTTTSRTSTKKAASPKKKTAKKPPTKKAAATSKKACKEVSIDRRRKTDRRDEEEAPEELQLERRVKVQRRRQIDPTTCERDYTDNEVEFMGALDDYKRASGRMFPTCSEVLEVIRNLGYIKLTAAEIAAREGLEQSALEAESIPGEPDPTKAFATAAEAHLVRE
jgi:hypothetical protein